MHSNALALGSVYRFCFGQFVDNLLVLDTKVKITPVFQLGA